MNACAFRTTAFAALAMTMISGASVADPAGPLQASEMKWGPAPPVLLKGAELAVLAGDPGKEGPVTVRLKMPKDYAIPAHWHPTDERVTVISGEFGLRDGATSWTGRRPRC